MQKIGGQIRIMRKVLGMTQARIAVRSGLTQGMIAKMEREQRNNPSFSVIRKLAEALNCDFSDQLSPKKDIPVFLEEQSERLARKIVAISSGSSAIELKPPSKKIMDEQILEIKKELLGKHKSALWQKI